MSFSIFLYEIHFFGQSLPQPQLVHLQSVQVQGPPEPQPQSVSGMVRQHCISTSCPPLTVWHSDLPVVCDGV